MNARISYAIRYVLLLGCLLLQRVSHAQPLVPEFWYDYQLKQMSLEQKIGQLFMVAAYSNKDAAHTAEIEDLIRNYHIGGLIFFQNDPLKQAYLCNYYQSLSAMPLLVGMDAEWGLAMRLKNTQKFPYALTLGATGNDSLVYANAAAMARQFKRLGVHINFAPDADINSNPKNPIIGFRAFGDNKHQVARLGDAYSKGMQSEGILSCAKHFPGHGDVHTDSHLDMPVVDKSLAELDSNELYPFRYLIQNGVSSVMVAHLHMPQLDNRPMRPASLSGFVIDTVLRKRLGFEGLVFTDALNMKGVSKYYSPGQADLEALLAGNDVLLFSENVPAAAENIRKAVLDGRLSIEELNKHVLRILRFKYFAGLNRYQPIEIEGLLKDLKGDENIPLLQTTANAALCLVKDPERQIPLKNKNKTLVIALGDEPGSEWKPALHAAGISNYLQAGKDPSAAQRSILLKKASAFQTIVVSLHSPKVWKQGNGGYTSNDFELIRQLSLVKHTIVIGFCNPYVLENLPDNIGILAAYEDLAPYQRAAAGVLNGTLAAKGSMPVKLGISMRTGSSLKTAPLPEKSSEGLNGIDGIVQQLLLKKAAPGCRVLVLKDGQPVFNRSYGHLNYNSPFRVNDSTLYDIASITKIAGTTIALMKLWEEGRLDLKQTLGHYLPRARGSNKENLILADILQHRAGLTAWIPFYKETLPYVDSVFCATEDSNFCVKVADKLFMLKANKDTIYKRIFDSPLESRTYRYSDLSMILMQLVAEQITGKALDVYLSEQFYTPMGLRHLSFNPWKQEKKDNIAPTQLDRMFRKQELCGYVHDPAAAMLGGVSGHAGLFSTASDLAAIMQMLCDSGFYKGKRYFKPATVQTFTAYQRPDSRRGLGFDKPDFNGGSSPASTLGSKSMFGHTGFTGTAAWADPEHRLVYVFLSNRICPVEENKELISGNYRTRIQDLIYRWLLD